MGVPVYWRNVKSPNDRKLRTLQVITKFIELYFNQLLLKERKTEVYKKTKMAVCGQFEWPSIERSEMERRTSSGRGDTSHVPDRDSQHFLLD